MGKFFLPEVIHDAYKIPPKPCPRKVKKPNYVIFMPDQLRYDSLGCTGNQHIKTPNIDAFAARGTRFTNCFVQASVCSQSRCSIFTGNYPHVTGHRSLEHLIKPWEPNLLRSLKEDGYHVACLAPRGDTFAPQVTELSLTEYGFLEPPEFIPKWGAPGPDQDPEANNIWNRLFYKGLRNAHEALDYDDAVVKSALAWLDAPPPKDTPWVLFMPLMFPHCPFQVEEPYFSMYDRSDMPLPSSKDAKTGYEPKYMSQLRDQYDTHRATEPVWREVTATYYGMISRLDDQFGRIIERLDTLKYWDSTVTCFFTDHGEYLGDHGMIEKWPSGLSDSLTHEPLIMAGAGIPAGVINEEMTEMVDLLPTVLQLSGIGQDFPHCGRSFAMSLMSGGQDTQTGQVIQHKEYAISEGGFLLSEEPLLEQSPYPYDIKAAVQHDTPELVGKALAVRNRDWTFIYRLYEPAELYDRRNDPQENHNLAEVAAHAETRRKMEGVTLKILFETSDFLPFQRDPRFPRVDLEDPQDQLEKRKANMA